MEKTGINANGRIEAFVVVLAEPGETKLKNKISIPSRMGLAAVITIQTRFGCQRHTGRTMSLKHVFTRKDLVKI